MNTKKLVFYAMAVAIGLVLSYVESLLPINMGVPGAKAGLSNIITIVMLYVFGFKPAFFVSLAKAVLAGFMFGNLFAILYSLFGLVFSILSMTALIRTKSFGVTAVSAVGGLMHNLGQLCIAVLLTNRYVLTYLPMLMFTGILAGIVIGVIGGLLTKRLSPFLRKTLNER